MELMASARFGSVLFDFGSISGAQIDLCPAHWSKFIQCVRHLLYLHEVCDDATPLPPYVLYSIYNYMYFGILARKQRGPGAAMLERENPLCVEMA